MTDIDPVAAVESVLSNNVNYSSDDATPVTENAANNGLIVEAFPAGKAKHMIAPMIEVGPIQHTEIKPQNIGNTPNSRWLYKHFIAIDVQTQTYQSPNVSGYNAITRICESIRQAIIQNQSTIDGSGNWLLLKLNAGPLDVVNETTLTPDRYERVFVVELWRSVVN